MVTVAAGSAVTRMVVAGSRSSKKNGDFPLVFLERRRPFLARRLRGRCCTEDRRSSTRDAFFVCSWCLNVRATTPSFPDTVKNN